MKTMAIVFAIFLLTFLIAYLTGSFCYAQFNLAKWSEEGRRVLTIWFTILFVIVSITYSVTNFLK